MILMNILISNYNNDGVNLVKYFILRILSVAIGSRKKLTLFMNAFLI